MADMLWAGVGRVDVTLPLTIPYLGYEPRHVLFEGVHDPHTGRPLTIDKRIPRGEDGVLWL